jgi:predicted Rossmann fold flavoprotein
MPKTVIVVGGGPAGMMAAGQAAQRGADVLLLEKMDRPGRKLRITGKGRCNLTNIAEIDAFLAHFGPSGVFLRQAFARFFSEDLVGFFEGLGVKMVTERGGRVFPASDQADEVADALLDWALAQGVTVRTASAVERLAVEADGGVAVGIAGPSSASGAVGDRGESAIEWVRGDAVILATGGASYPGTGSTGDGYRLAKELGHTIVLIRPALVPLDTAGDVAARLEGLSLRNVAVRVWFDDRMQDQAFGEMLFTRFGVSGPIILTLSRDIVDALRSRKRVRLSIDLKPALDDEKLDARLLRELDARGKRQYRTLLKDLLPRTLIPVCIEQTGIPADKVAHQITAMERLRLLRWLKDFRLEVTGHRPIAQAIITAGGVDTREVDPRTMASRLVPGLYLAGELLDVDADTGGYNLQAAFSTGWMAGRSAVG